jgi:hypothetical protein
MLIALDYDNTFTTAPDLWVQLIRIFKASGHRFICITSRENTPRNQHEISQSIGQYMPVIYCNHVAKAKHAKNLGYKPDIWIDDRPETIPTSIRQWKPNRL